MECCDDNLSMLNLRVYYTVSMKDKIAREELLLQLRVAVAGGLPSNMLPLLQLQVPFGKK